MKKIVFITTLLIALVTLSCEKEPSRARAPELIFRVDFDGQTFEADQAEAKIIDNVLIITTSNEATEEVFTLEVARIVTTFELGDNGPLSHLATYNQSSNPNDEWVSFTDGVSSQGVVIIDEINSVQSTLAGSFSFVGNNPSEGNTDNFIKQFTNGVFDNIPYEFVIPDDDDDPTINNSFTAKIDGVEYEEDLLSGTLTNPSGDGNINITATRTDLDTIGLTFPSDITPGSYEFGFGIAPLGQYNIFTPAAGHIADGSFTIITHDIANKRIVGTFAFVAEAFGGGATESFDITEGSFDVTYE